MDVKNLAMIRAQTIKCFRMDDCLPIGRAKQSEQQILCLPNEAQK